MMVIGLGEKKGRRYPADERGQPAGMSGVKSAKPYNIAKRTVWEAYRQVKANRGAAGIDDETIAEFEQNPSKRSWTADESGVHPHQGRLETVIHRTAAGCTVRDNGRGTCAPHVGGHSGAVSSV